MQVTVDQDERWCSDATAFVAEGDIDAFGVRSACEMLLNELQVWALSGP